MYLKSAFSTTGYQSKYENNVPAKIRIPPIVGICRLWTLRLSPGASTSFLR